MQIWNKITAISLVASLVLITSGCDGGDADRFCEMLSTKGKTKPNTQISAVIAPTSNFVDFSTIVTAAEPLVAKSLGRELADSELKDAIGRELSVVVADGTPQLAIKRTVAPLGEDIYDIETAIDKTYKVFDLVAGCAAGKLKQSGDEIPTDEESDLIAGISLAADQFTSTSSEKVLYILGNGIQTSGALKMQEPGQFPKDMKTADNLVESLVSIGALPDLDGVRVVWFGLGQVDGTQPKLDQKSRDSLVYFWQKLISESNGTLESTDIQKQVGSGTPHKNAISVSLVPISSCGIVVKLYEKDGVQFEPDSNVFIDLNKAKAKAKDVVTSFKAEHCETMTVHGYAAAGVSQDEYEANKSDIDQTNSALTLLRAKAFAKLLKDAGFDGEIGTEGSGTCGTEWKSDGSVDKVLQKECRRVEVTN